MTRRLLCGLIFCGLLLLAPTVTGQHAPTVLQLETNAPEATVHVDGRYLGLARTRYFEVDAGPREVRLHVGTSSSWSVPSVSARIEISSPGDTVIVRCDFPYYYRLESTPYDATVSLRDGVTIRVLGQTPSTVESPRPLEGVLEFHLDGFRTQDVMPGTELWNLHVIRLEPLAESGEVTRFALSPGSSRRKWIDYVAIGTALVAGATAVHFKFKADRRYDRYVETGDPALRPGVKRYDTYSGVALGVMQASAGLFAVRLILR